MPHGTLGGEILDWLCFEAKLYDSHFGRCEPEEPLVND